MQALSPCEQFAIEGMFTKSATSSIFVEARSPGIRKLVGGSREEQSAWVSEGGGSEAQGVTGEDVSSQIWEIESCCNHRISDALRGRRNSFRHYPLGLE